MPPKPKAAETDPLEDMEKLLQDALRPGSNLYRYVQVDLLGEEADKKADKKAKEETAENAEGKPCAKPDAKPLKEVLTVLQQLRELRGTNRCEELRVVFADPGKEGWSE